MLGEEALLFPFSSRKPEPLVAMGSVRFYMYLPWAEPLSSISSVVMVRFRCINKNITYHCLFSQGPSSQTTPQSDNSERLVAWDLTKVDTAPRQATSISIDI
jgi:hypothetical protein